MGFLSGFLYSQLLARLPYPEGSYAGQTVVVTGSSAGLGKEASRHFARLGASKIILANRSPEKAEAVKKDIEATTGCGKDVIQLWPLDMASYASVQQFAQRVAAELERVDIFIANAGVAKVTYRVAEDNEETITINVVSTFLLTALIIPKMKETAAKYNTRPTFTITASGVHQTTKFPQQSAPEGQIFAALNDKEGNAKYWDQQYPISKLLEIFAVRAIGERHPAAKYPVTINCVDPGLCHSELARDIDGWGFWLMKLVFARSTELGSRTLVHAASQGEESHGKYLSDCAIAEPSETVTSAEGKVAQDRVWNELVGKLNKIQPDVISCF